MKLKHETKTYLSHLTSTSMKHSDMKHFSVNFYLHGYFGYFLDKNTLQKVYLQQSEENDDFNCLCQKFFMLLFLILLSTKNVSCFMCLFLKYFKRRNIPKMAQKMFHETLCFVFHVPFLACFV